MAVASRQTRQGGSLHVSPGASFELKSIGGPCTTRDHKATPTTNQTLKGTHHVKYNT